MLACANYGYAQMPVDDLDGDAGLSEPDKNLLRQVRQNSKAQLSSFELAFLVDAAESLGLPVAPKAPLQPKDGVKATEVPH